EQATGNLGAQGPCSDIYSLGATLYCLLTGRPPFEGDDVGEVLRRSEAGAFPSPRVLDPTIDRPLDAASLQALALRPEERYPSPRGLAEDAERGRADEAVSAWREPLARRAQRWARRNRTAVTGATVALVAGLAGLGAVLTVQARANKVLASRNEA